MALCVLPMGAVAVAQETPPQSGSRSAPAEPQQAPAFQPGFIDLFSRWLGDSKTMLDEQIKNSTNAAKGAADAAGQAVLGLPVTRVVNGRERCAVAPNGAPDCGPAAEALCRSKGLGSGRSVDINSAYKCPAWVWLSGRQPPEGVCTTETFVLRATCR